MPEIWKKWLGLVNCCIYNACQIHEIYKVLSYSVDFKAPAKLWNQLIKVYLLSVVLFGVKDL